MGLSDEEIKRFLSRVSNHKIDAQMSGTESKMITPICDDIWVKNMLEEMGKNEETLNQVTVKNVKRVEPTPKLFYGVHNLVNSMNESRNVVPSIIAGIQQHNQKTASLNKHAREKDKQGVFAQYLSAENSRKNFKGFLPKSGF